MINYDYLKFIHAIKINYSLNDIQNDIVEIYKQNYKIDFILLCRPSLKCLLGNPHCLLSDSHCLSSNRRFLVDGS